MSWSEATSSPEHCHLSQGHVGTGANPSALEATPTVGQLAETELVDETARHIHTCWEMKSQ